MSVRDQGSQRAWPLAHAAHPVRTSPPAQVHATIYDATLALMLEGDAAKLSEEDLEYLGELEGMLQVGRLHPDCIQTAPRLHS